MADQDNRQEYENTGRWSHEPVPEVGAPVVPGKQTEADTQRKQSTPQVLNALATHPLIVAVATGLGVLVAVVGLSLEWARTVVGAGAGEGQESAMSFSVSGFGLIQGRFDAAGLQESWMDAMFLSISASLIFLVLASALLIAFTPLRRVGSVVVAASGVGFIAYSIYGMVTGLGVEDELFSGDTAAMTEEDQAIIQSLIDSLNTSTGPGTYVTLVAGVLLVAVGAYFALRSGFDWFPRPQQPAVAGEAPDDDVAVDGAVSGTVPAESDSDAAGHFGR